MCGLVGVASPSINLNDIKVFKQALYADALRGFHSTGVAAAAYNNKKKKLDVTTRKMAVPSAAFLSAKGTEDYFNQVFKGDTKALLGHNRWATLGKINHINAHPFVEDHIVMAHNGTLDNQRLLPEHYYFEVDSANIAYAISKIGIEETVSKLDGSFALSWYNTQDKTLNLIRNSERPLFIFMDEKSGKTFWCSEREMGEWILERNNWKYTNIYEPKPGQLFSFDLLNMKNSFNEVELKEFKLYTKPRNNFHTNNFNRTNRYNNHHTTQRQHPISNYEEKEDNVIVLPPTKEKSRGEKRKEKLNDSLLRYGFKPEEEVEFSLEKFFPYDGTESVGYVIGQTVEPPYLKVEVHGVDKLDVQKQGIVSTNALCVSNREGEWPTLMGAYLYNTIDDDSDEVAEAEILIESEDYNEEKSKELFAGPSGTLISYEEMDVLTGCGCAVCQGNIYEDEYDKVGWTMNSMPLCVDCKKEWEL